jgi:hypothetical protein
MPSTLIEPPMVLSRTATSVTWPFFDQGFELTVADRFDLLAEQRILRDKHHGHRHDEVGNRKILFFLIHGLLAVVTRGDE